MYFGGSLRGKQALVKLGAETALRSGKGEKKA
jgi:hypothetical protein